MNDVITHGLIESVTLIIFSQVKTVLYKTDTDGVSQIDFYNTFTNVIPKIIILILLIIIRGASFGEKNTCDYFD